MMEMYKNGDLLWPRPPETSIKRPFTIVTFMFLFLKKCQTYSVPGRSSCQFTLLQQHHIFHATFGQVIGHADAHTSTPNDECVCGVLPPLSQNWGGIPGGKKRKVTRDRCGSTVRHATVHSWAQMETMAVRRVAQKLITRNFTYRSKRAYDCCLMWKTDLTVSPLFSVFSLRAADGP